MMMENARWRRIIVLDCAACHVCIDWFARPPSERMIWPRWLSLTQQFPDVIALVISLSTVIAEVNYGTLGEDQPL